MVHQRERAVSIFQVARLYLFTEVIMAVLISIIVQQVATMYSLLYFCKLLYMFQVVTPPIIRSTYDCNYSIWHWSNFGKCSVWSQLKMGGIYPSLLPAAIVTAIPRMQEIGGNVRNANLRITNVCNVYYHLFLKHKLDIFITRSEQSWYQLEYLWPDERHCHTLHFPWVF